MAVWIEAKLDSPLSGDDQLTKYKRALQASSGESKRLLVLAPACSRRTFQLLSPRTATPAEHELGPHFVAWEDVYATIEKWAGDDQSARGVWLAQEVLEYMRDQELGRPPLLSQRHVKALKEMPQAIAALQALVDEAAERVVSSWGPLLDRENDQTYAEHRHQPWRRGGGPRDWARGTAFG